VVPTNALGDRRVATFGLLLPTRLARPPEHHRGQRVTVLRLHVVARACDRVLTEHASHVFVGAVSAVTLIAVAVLTKGADLGSLAASGLATDLIELLAFLLFTAFAGRALRDARRAITARAEELAHERTTAMELAFTDTLTGLYNRRVMPMT
jgi:hypothetical protein